MEMSTIGVIGAGIMGRGIAYATALGGYQVKLMDTSEEVLRQAMEAIHLDVEEGVRRGKVNQELSLELMGRITTNSDLAATAQLSDFIIEAVPEDLELKRNVFRVLDAEAPAHTVLATNTSAKSITEIAAITNNPQRVIGMHFFNPVQKMKLVEVIKGLETSSRTLKLTFDVAEQMGKEPVEIAEFPGFVTTRINAMIGNEAFYMLMEGVASAEDIDHALKIGLNHPMGPFELGDLVGWDTRLENLRYLNESLGEKYRPCPLLVQYVKAGRLGRKTGRGVFDYNQGSGD